MPTYDYECKNCHHAFEEFQSITAKPLKKCPVCSKRSLERLIGAGAGVIFRGSGFYTTDYRSKEYKEKLKDEGFRDRFAGLIQGDVYGGRTRGGKSDSAAKQEAPSSNSSAKSNLSAPSSPKDKITRQMQGRNPDKKPSSTANAGKKADKPTKQVKQGGYKGNWVNAGPAKKPRSMQEAVRGADAGASFMRGRLTGRNR